MTSYGISTGRNFKGYHLEVSFPSAPHPSPAERERARSEQQQLLDRAASLAARAFSHYVGGSHPYVAVRSVVLRAQDASQAAEFWRTSPVELLDGVEIVLFVQPNLSDRVRNQVRRDFLLSQLAPGGVLSSPEHLAQLTKKLDPRPPARVLELGLYSMSQIVYALKNRAHIEQAVQTEGARSPSGILLQAVLATLDGKPIADALVEAAAALPPGPRAQTFERLLELSPCSDPAQVRKWAGYLEEHRRANYIDPPPR